MVLDEVCTIMENISHLTGGNFSNRMFGVKSTQLQARSV